ncbi:MAG: hypothetical protein OQK76_03545 [Gammaproteobacteria bacterium]|nr:hypothetical protein [Gammaproteobacteria bacterium]MCW9005763.1 hypothetical protein [Gammaproteobacteria bacterium]
MKLNLVLIALLLAYNPSHADTTIMFKIPDNTHKQNTHTYYIKGSLLRLVEEGRNKINVFDQSKEEFTTIDQATGNISRINQDIVNQHIEKLNKQRLDKLKSVETELNKKLQSMDADKKEAAELLMNKLKYPEFYGEHSYLQTTKTSTTKHINNIECHIYNVTLQKNLVRQICMASLDKLKISPQDYTTLRAFYKFNYDTQSRIMIAAGKASFTFVDFEDRKIPGIPVEVTIFTEQGSKQEQILDQIKNTPLDKDLFEIKTH